MFVSLPLPLKNLPQAASQILSGMSMSEPVFDPCACVRVLIFKGVLFARVFCASVLV